MKYKKIILTLLLVTTVFGACKDKLNVVPYDSLSTSESLSDVNGLSAALAGAYSGLRNNSYYGQEFMAIGEISADNVYISITNSNRYITTFRRDYTTIDADVNSIWDQIYAVLLEANNIINNADAAKGDATQKNIIKGQALFIRALCHFDLVRLFAKPYTQGDGSQLGVPIETKFEVGTPARNTVAEVYTQVINDLTAAKTLLADESIGDAYDVNKYAVSALLSRVYLYKGDNTNAITEASVVIGSGQYTLTPPADLPTFYTTSNNPEEIFTLRFLASESQGSENYGGLYLRPGYGDVRVSPDLVNDFEPGDARRNFISPFSASPSEFQNDKFSGEAGIFGLYSPKVLRLAEIYLNRAEAYAKTSQYPLAIADLNTLRAKRGLPALTTVADADVLTRVLDERRKEFMFEGQRFFDLTRNSVDVERGYCQQITEVSAPCSISATAFNAILPIPQQEINVNPIPQNPGYGK